MSFRSPDGPPKGRYVSWMVGSNRHWKVLDTETGKRSLNDYLSPIDVERDVRKFNDGDMLDCKGWEDSPLVDFRPGDVSQLLHVSTETVRKMSMDGRLTLKYRTPSGQRRFHVDEVLRTRKYMMRTGKSE